MAEWENKNSYRGEKKTEPYGFVLNSRLFKLAYNDERLTAEPRLLLAYLISHCDNKGKCFPSLQKIAKDQCVERQAIQNRLNPLIKYEYIIREPRFGNSGVRLSNMYRLNFSLLDAENYSEVPEVNCPTATSEGCTPAISDTCSLASSGSCTKKPYKKTNKIYSFFELNRILFEVREIALDGLDNMEKAKITAKFSKEANGYFSQEDQLLSQVDSFVEFGLARGCNMRKFEDILQAL